MEYFAQPASHAAIMRQEESQNERIGTRLQQRKDFVIAVERGACVDNMLRRCARHQHQVDVNAMRGHVCANI